MTSHKNSRTIQPINNSRQLRSAKYINVGKNILLLSIQRFKKEDLITLSANNLIHVGRGWSFTVINGMVAGSPSVLSIVPENLFWTNTKQRQGTVSFMAFYTIPLTLFMNNPLTFLSALLVERRQIDFSPKLQPIMAAGQQNSFQFFVVLSQHSSSTPTSWS